MNQGLVCRFGLKLCQNVATGSRNPLEPLRTPQTPKNSKNHEISDFFPPPPLIPLLALRAISAVGSTSGALYTCLAHCAKLVSAFNV